MKELKKLFNAKDTGGFIKYWKESGLSPNFQDTVGRNWMFWFVGANIVGNDNPYRVLEPILIYFASNQEAVIDWDQKDFTGM